MKEWINDFVSPQSPAPSPQFEGRLFGQYYGSSTDFIHQNHLGSTSMVSDHTGTPIQDTLLYPWGQPWAQTGGNYDNHYAGMQWRNFKTSLEPTPARMYQ